MYPSKEQDAYDNSKMSIVHAIGEGCLQKKNA